MRPDFGIVPAILSCSWLEELSQSFVAVALTKFPIQWVPALNAGNRSTHSSWGHEKHHLRLHHQSQHSNSFEKHSL
ncbi:hypothetical protein BCR37DRAFT_384499 [Protomyces lactucae-debilis]|uniref:Uncharacterized protein n=1 Tax=Protomyces lactucae-debilis TaxID=2754530 RepID=A0A1Y2ES62_PROLT|nr:uncharacterized protein BCR37DRAFT_384499 [Protomyces lactucae-debilis]ORY74372.1 hypothetical protein BCR37DRAFT_384499 [Protomyces lactucae-debilis]